jgi:hypothetical protein
MFSRWEISGVRESNVKVFFAYSTSIASEYLPQNPTLVHLFRNSSNKEKGGARLTFFDK